MSHFLAFTINCVQFLIFLHLQQTCLNESDNCHIYVSVYQTTSHYAVLRHSASHYVIFHYSTSQYIILRQSKSHNVIIHHSMSHYGTLRHSTLCHISSLYVTSNISLSEFILYNNSLNFINVIFFLIDTQAEYAGVFVNTKCFQPSLIFMDGLD